MYEDLEGAAVPGFKKVAVVETTQMSKLFEMQLQSMPPYGFVKESLQTCHQWLFFLVNGTTATLLMSPDRHFVRGEIVLHKLGSNQP